jgi:hypothetical protein
LSLSKRLRVPSIFEGLKAPSQSAGYDGQADYH